MTSNQKNNTLVEEIMKSLISNNSDGIKIVLETLFNLAMKEERKQQFPKAFNLNIFI